MIRAGGRTVAVGGLMHESNAFRADRTPLSAFIRVPPEAIETTFADTSMELTGFLRAAESAGARIASLPFAWADSSGLVESSAAHTLVTAVVDEARRTQPDAVLLALHGSMTATDDDDVEGTLLTALRSALGPDVVIGATLDWHCSVTPAMTDAADVLVAYRTYPHVDQLDTAERLATQVFATLDGTIRPTQATVRLPLLIAGPATSHHNEPMAGLLAAADAAMAARPDVLDWSICPGFARADTPLVGVHTHAVTDGAPHAAAAAADELAALVWATRDGFTPTLASVDDAVAALTEPGASRGPVVLSDQGDNPGGGTPGDGTTLLRALVDADVDGSVVAAIADPAAVAIAHDAGVGATITVSLGGHRDDRHGPPVAIEAVVEHLGDGHYTMRSPTHDGVPRAIGPTATIRVGRVRVIVTSTPVQNEDLELLEACGVDPRSARAIAVKSNAHFRAAFAPLASRIIDVDTPGLSTPHLARLPYERVPRPVFPLDPDTTWTAGRA